MDAKPVNTDGCLYSLYNAVIYKGFEHLKILLSPMESIPHRYQRKTNNKYLFLYFLFHILFQLNSPHASKSILHSIFNKQLILSHLPKAGFAIFLLWIPIALFFLLNYHWSLSLVRRLWDGETQKGILLGSSLGGQQALGSEGRVGLQYCLCKDLSHTHGELWSYEDASDCFEWLKEGQGLSIPLSTSHWLWGPGARATDSNRQPCLAVNCRRNEASENKGEEG